MTSNVYEQAAKRYAHIRSVFITRKTLAAFGVLAVIVSIVAVGVVIAYLTDRDAVQNDFTIASNSIEIIEEFPESPAPIEESEIEKVVQICNTGTSACFVRVAIEYTDDRAAEFAELNIASESWTERHDDGYYYTIEPVEVGATTDPLLDGVTIGAATEEGYFDFGIIVYAESVQAIDPESGLLYPDGPTAFAALAKAKGEDYA